MRERKLFFLSGHGALIQRWEDIKRCSRIPVANGVQSEYMVLDRELPPSEPLSFPTLPLS